MARVPEQRPSSPVPAIIAGVLGAVLLVFVVQFVLGAVFALVRVVVLLGLILLVATVYFRLRRSSR